MSNILGSSIASKGRPDICLLVRAFSGGGAQRDAILLANGLQAAGWVSAIITLDARGELASLVDPAVPVFDLGAGRCLRMTMAAPVLSRLLRQLRPRAWVASEASGNSLAVLANLLIPVDERPFLILREVASPCAARQADPYLQNRIGYRLAPWLYGMADLVTTFTEGARGELLDAFRLPADKVVNLGTNCVLTAERLRQLSAGPAARQPNLIVNVGRLSPEKDQQTLLAAFTLLRQARSAHLVIAGDGPERAHLVHAAEALGIAESVTFLGHVAEPLAVLQKAQLFVSSSRHEGLGNAIIEALACGVPVVATDAPHGPREILDGGRLGTLVPVGDTGALARAMAVALDQPPTNREPLFSRAGNFSVERAARRFADTLAGRGLFPSRAFHEAMHASIA